MASQEQRELMAEFYDHSGFEFMKKEEVKANDPAGFLRLFRENVDWLRDVAGECDRMTNDYYNRHLDEIGDQLL